MSEKRASYGLKDAAELTLLREMERFYGPRAESYRVFGQPLTRLKHAELIAALAMLIERPELASNSAAVQRVR